MSGTKPDSSQFAQHVPQVVREYVRTYLAEQIDELIKGVSERLAKAEIDAKQAKMDSLEAKVIALEASEIANEPAIRVYGRE